MKILAALVPVATLLLAGCGASSPELVAPGPRTPLPPAGVLSEDTAPKEDLRLVPPEAYMRTYLQLFGGLAPLDDGSQLFDTWDDYVSALGLPDYRFDIPRQSQTNALMVATFERLGVALCDRALEHDLRAPKGGEPPPVAERLVFAFDAPGKGELDAAAFGPRFDTLHRTFLGYPASLAPPGRVARYYQLYRDVEAGHVKADPKSRFSPAEAGWAAVCYGLVRHPEFHTY